MSSDPLVRRAAPQPFDLAAPALALEAALAGCGGRLRRLALPLDAKCLPQRRDEPLDRQLAVARLTPLVLRHRPQYRTGFRHDASLLCLGQRIRRLDVEDGDDSSLGLLRVLP